ncbi:hypothetical protein HW130_25515 [Streptomyces sp. PKU-EA00015]|nr:hypothetical protein [Streptomyces sp. PKU-EA00015]
MGGEEELLAADLSTIGWWLAYEESMTVHHARTVPRDRASLRAFGAALAGMPWVLREQRVVPPVVERRLKLLETAQRHSTARRYVG